MVGAEHCHFFQHPAGATLLLLTILPTIMMNNNQCCILPKPLTTTMTMTKIIKAVLPPASGYQRRLHTCNRRCSLLSVAQINPRPLKVCPPSRQDPERLRIASSMPSHFDTSDGWEHHRMCLIIAAYDSRILTPFPPAQTDKC